MARTKTPAETLIAITKKIDVTLKGVVRPRVLHDRKQASKLRSELFQLEGWARLHRRWPFGKVDQKFFNELRDASKELEDVLGAVDTANVLLEEASKLGIPKLIEYETEELHVREQQMKEILRKRRWLVRTGKTRSQKIIARLKKVDWPEPKTHFAYLKGEIEREIQSFRKSFEKEIRPILLKEVYSQEDVEGDLHEWRRQLRWYAIYFQSSQGLFTLGPLPKKRTKEEARLVEELKESPYAKLPNSGRPKAKVDAMAYLELTRLIDVIGHLKEEAEMFFYVRNRLLTSRAAKNKNEANKLAREIYGPVPEKIPSLVRPLLKEVDRFKPLRKIGQGLNKSS